MSERWSTLGLFCLGAALFLAGYLIAVSEMPLGFPLVLEAATALFGLPFVVRELWRRTNWLAVAYFLLVVPAFHRAAMETAVRVYRLVEALAADTQAGAVIPSMPGPGAMVAAGLAGGFVGGSSLLLLALPRLRAPGPGWWRLAGLGLAAVTLIGGLVLGLGGEFALLAVYPLWQIPFGWFLSRLIRPSPPRATERPCRGEGFPP